MNKRQSGLFFSLWLLKAFLCWTPAFAATPSLTTKTWHTTQGARVVFYKAKDVPMLDVNIAFAAGSAYDGKQWGLSALTTTLLNQGNANLDASHIADAFAQVGAQYTTTTSQDMVALKLRTLTSAKALKQAVSTFALVVQKPDFPKAAFLHEQDQQRLLIQQELDVPDVIANNTFYQTLYRDHPYAHPIHGNQTTIDAIKLDDVRRFYQQYFVGRNAVIVLVGAIDTKEAHRIAEQITEALPEGKHAEPVPMANPLTESLTISAPHSGPQTAIRIGQLGMTHQDPDYYPLQVGNYILGGGSLVSKLAIELRERRGLTYNVNSQFVPMPGRGPFIIAFSTKNHETNNSLNITQTVLSDFIKQGPTEEELIAAKQYLTGSFPLSLASNNNMAEMLLKIAFYNLPPDFLNTYVARVNAVSRTEITAALQRHLNPAVLLQVTVGEA